MFYTRINRCTDITTHAKGQSLLCKIYHVHSNRLNTLIFIPLIYLNPYITKEILKALEQRIQKTEILSKLAEKQKFHTQHIAV